MAKKLAQDRLLFGIILVLLSFGAVMVFSSSAVLSMDLYGNSYTFGVKHLLIVGISLVLMILVSNRDYRKLINKSTITVLLLTSLGLLVLVLFLSPVNNTYRWFRFGMFSFQPSELAKISLVLFIGYFLSQHYDRINLTPLKIMPVFFIVLVISGLIIIEPDVGTALTILFIVITMFFISGLSLRYYIVGGIGLIGVLYYLVVNSDYRTGRVLAYIDPWADPLGYGFQPIQSMIAIGSGGLFGAGLAKGTQKYFYLPTPHTDFIYSVIGEELGFIGSMTLLLLFGALMWRGLRIARRAPDHLGKIVAIGITVMFVAQAFINVSVATTLLPTKGIPLPFISFGGTAMIFNLIAAGILLNISRYTT
jgi:cell division protein FtsW